MPVLSRDTHPEIERIQIALLREAPPWRKMQLLGQLNQTVRVLAMSGLKQRFPQEPPERLRRRLADLLLGPELALKVYGPLDE